MCYTLRAQQTQTCITNPKNDVNNVVTEHVMKLKPRRVERNNTHRKTTTPKQNHSEPNQVKISTKPPDKTYGPDFDVFKPN